MIIQQLISRKSLPHPWGFVFEEMSHPRGQILEKVPGRGMEGQELNAALLVFDGDVLLWRNGPCKWMPC